MSLKTKHDPQPEFAPNLKDPGEMTALGGVDQMLGYYRYLMDKITAKPSIAADKDRPACISQLRAGLRFLTECASIHTRKEYASASYDRCAPKAERAALAARADALGDEARKVLKKLDLWEGF